MFRGTTVQGSGDVYYAHERNRELILRALKAQEDPETQNVLPDRKTVQTAVEQDVEFQHDNKLRDQKLARNTYINNRATAGITNYETQVQELIVQERTENAEVLRLVAKEFDLRGGRAGLYTGGLVEAAILLEQE